MAPRLNESIDECSLCGEKCDFVEIMTEDGLCFTFNMFNGNETYNDKTIYSHLLHHKAAHWNLENGYEPNIDYSTYPYRVFGSGADGESLTISLALSKTFLTNRCQSRQPGYKLVLHTPGEIPQASKYYWDISMHEISTVLVNPKIIETSEGLRRIPSSRRKCYFDSERKLHFLKVYTQRNCQLECLSNFSLSVCGCVKYSMPREENTPICSPSKGRCLDWTRNNMMERRIKTAEFIEEKDVTRFKKLVNHCNCLPTCKSITYDAEILRVPLNASDLTDIFKDDKSRIFTQITIFFKENEFFTLTRSELYGPIDFVANCGGLLGLFLGASFLSIVELLYYCTLRLCCNIKKHPKLTSKISNRNARKRINKKRKKKIAVATLSKIIIVTEAAKSG